MSTSTSLLDDESTTTTAPTLDTSSIASGGAPLDSEKSDKLYDHDGNAKDASLFCEYDYHGYQYYTIITGERSNTGLLQCLDVESLINYWLA